MRSKKLKEKRKICAFICEKSACGYAAGDNTTKGNQLSLIAFRISGYE